MYTFLTASLKITSGEISAKEVAGEGRSKAKEHHRQEAIKAICTSKHLQSLQNLFFKKSAITHHSIPSINTPINPSSNPSSPHPEERIWAGRTPRREPRAPDAPRSGTLSHMKIYVHKKE